MISKDQINDILLSTNLINVVEESGVKLKKSGAWLYNGICPFHNEKDGSFYVNTRTNTYKCYGCGAWGNAIDFLIKRNGLTFLEAARKLAGKYNISIEEFTPTKEQEAEEKLKSQLLNIYEDAAQFYSLQLEQNTKALKYIRSRFDDETVDGFRIGFAPDELIAGVYSPLFCCLFVYFSRRRPCGRRIGKKHRKGKRCRFLRKRYTHFVNKIFSFFLRYYDTIPAGARIGVS